MIKDNQDYNEKVKVNTKFLEELYLKLPEFFTKEKKDSNGNVIDPSTFDLEKFKKVLEENNVSELTNGYQLDFIGKNYAKKQSGELPNTVLVPDVGHNQKDENKNSQNLFLTGDNLEVLRHLQHNYSNSVDCIYIDPPYNTNSNEFVYPDKFEYSDEELKLMFDLDEEGIKKLKSIQGKSTHSAWMTFMYPRLFLAKKVLKDTGVIFISIDENEQANLKLLMDDIWGEDNFITNFIWEKKKKPSFLNSNLGTKYEYISVYAKSRRLSKPFSIEKTTKGKKYPFNNSGNGVKVLKFPPDSVQFTNLEDGTIKAQDMSNGNIITELLEDVEVYNGKNKNTIVLKGEWRYNQEKLNEFVEQGNLITISSIPFRPNLVMMGGEIKKMHNLLTLNQYPIATNEDATEEFINLMGKNYFSFTKPTELIKLLLKSYLYDNSDAIILDFFAGSSTTAEAVMKLNLEDDGNRKYIMCTLPEPTYYIDKNGKEIPTKGGLKAFEDGYKSIDELSRERIYRASQKIKSETKSSTTDLGFKHFNIVHPKIETLEKLQFDNNMQLNIFEDMISAFSSEKLGLNTKATGFETILWTYLVRDNHKFNTEVKMIDFDGLRMPYIDNKRIYIITENWTTKNTKRLVNLIGRNELIVQTIIVYGYTIDMEILKELKIALNQVSNKVNLQIRY